jgi:flagellar biosynthesis protein FlhA
VPQNVERLLDMDVLELEIGPGLVVLADVNRGGDLLPRVTAVREQIAIELGIIVPAIGIRDNKNLGMNDYAIRIRGQVIARGAAYPEQFMAIDDGDASGAIVGEAEVSDPARGRLAYWITESQRTNAQSLGYTVAEAPAVIINHLTEVIRVHAHEMLTRQAVRNLLDNLKSRGAAAVVEEVVPKLAKPGEVQRVLQNLLRERVPVRDLETILETLGDYAIRTSDTELLTEHVRVALARTICRQYVDDHDRLHCLMLEAHLEELIAGHVERTDGGGGAINTMPPGTAQRIGEEMAQEAAAHTEDGHPPVVLCAPAVRSAVRKLLEPIAPHVAVLSLSEVVGDVTPQVVGVVSVGEVSGDHHGDHVDHGLGNQPGQSLVEDGYESANV